MVHFAITTDLGLIEGRNAIYLDRLFQDHRSLDLTFEGEIDTRMTTGYIGESEWVSFRLKFFRSDSYVMTKLDCYEKIDDLPTCFNRLTEPFLKTRLSNFSQYSLATYDHIFDIIATEYSLEYEDSPPG